LKHEEILICLAQLNIILIKGAKFKPNYHIFKGFIEYFSGKNFDVISTPKLSGVDCFLYPELHEESVIVIASHRVLQRIFLSVGMKYFSLNEYYSKNYKTFQKNISGIVNLARFREDNIKILSKFSKTFFFFSNYSEQLNFYLFRRIYKLFILKKFLVSLLILPGLNFFKQLFLKLINVKYTILVTNKEKLVRLNSAKFFKDFGGKKLEFINNLSNIFIKKLIYFKKEILLIHLKIHIFNLLEFYQLHRAFYNISRILNHFLFFSKKIYPIVFNILSSIYIKKFYLDSLKNCSNYLSFKLFIDKNLCFNNLDSRYNNSLNTKKRYPKPYKFKKFKNIKFFSIIVGYFKF